VIGANLGFVQFPANGTEPRKASPQVAAHIANVHKLFLSRWESLHDNIPSQDGPRDAAAGATSGAPPQLKTESEDEDEKFMPHLGGSYPRPTLQKMNAAMQFIRLTEEDYSNKRLFPSLFPN